MSWWARRPEEGGAPCKACFASGENYYIAMPPTVMRVGLRNISPWFTSWQGLKSLGDKLQSASVIYSLDEVNSVGNIHSNRGRQVFVSRTRLHRKQKTGRTLAFITLSASWLWSQCNQLPQTPVTVPSRPWWTVPSNPDLPLCLLLVRNLPHLWDNVSKAQ